MALITVEGTYKDGQVQLTEAPAELPAEARVIVTFMFDPRPLGSSPEGSRQAAARRLLERLKAGINFGGRPYQNREELYDRLDRY